MLRAKIDRKSTFLKERGQFGPKFQVEGVVLTNHSSCHKTRQYKNRIIVYKEWYKNFGSRLFRFVTVHWFKRQTNRLTERETDINSAERPCAAAHAFAVAYATMQIGLDWTRSSSLLKVDDLIVRIGE